MRTDFDIRVHVDLGVTPELVSLVNALIGQKQLPSVLSAPVVSDKPSVGVESPSVPEQEESRQEALPSVPEPEPEAQPAEVPSGEAEPEPVPVAVEEPRELTEEDIRDAMHRTRQRIEGENYKDETDSELYKKYHRQLTAQFKNIAAMLGADKPSALPAEQRAAFIAQCDELIAGEDGVIIRVPF